MNSKRRLTRRSFLVQVSGGAIGVGALGIVSAGHAGAQTGPYTGITDTDSGSHADNAGHGRGPGQNRSGQPQTQTGVTDRDPSDPVGGGRGGEVSGYSDSDSGPGADPSGRGRRGQQSGRYDSDPTDAGGQGRGTSTPPAGQHTGITDSDYGPRADRGGYGRGSVRQDADRQDQGVIITRPRSQCTDSDQSPRDPVGRGRHC